MVLLEIGWIFQNILLDEATNTVNEYNTFFYLNKKQCLKSLR